jgi:type II secretory pathway component GspD/PulD (secretin)
MNQIRIFEKISNLEIISKIMNSVAKQCGCRIRYDAEANSICFDGDAVYQEYIAETTLSFFRTT